ncbi:sterol desaturase family protein [Pseudomonadota bacterium]
MNVFKQVVTELESDPSEYKLGQGWISGVLGLVLAAVCLSSVIILKYPQLLTTPEIRNAIDVTLFRSVIQGLLVVAFAFSVISLILREKRIMGLSTMVLILVSLTLGGAQAQQAVATSGQVYFALDWFMLNLLFSGIIFLPLERIFYRHSQAVFRKEWREDLTYFFISSLMVQGLTYLSMAPSLTLLQGLEEAAFRVWVGEQPLMLQLLAIMFFTDFVQYWVHRLFHTVPALWRFHAIHHSAETLDWLAGSRMHLVEVVALRSTTIIPMYLLGFSTTAIYAYLILVYLYSTYIHANVRWDIEWLKPIIVTPRFHHWHHGIEKEAVDVNFAVHFPLFDRLFGTYYMPKGQWPSGYGARSVNVPKGYLKQFVFPFTQKK